MGCWGSSEESGETIALPSHAESKRSIDVPSLTVIPFFFSHWRQNYQGRVAGPLLFKQRKDLQRRDQRSLPP